MMSVVGGGWCRGDLNKFARLVKFYHFYIKMISLHKSNTWGRVKVLDDDFFLFH